MMKKILVACGTGMSTSTMIAQKLQGLSCGARHCGNHGAMLSE